MRWARAGDDQIGVRGHARDGEVALVAALLVQHAACRRCGRRHRHVVGAEALQSSASASGPCTRSLANDVWSKSGHRLARGAVLGAPRGEPVLAPERVDRRGLDALAAANQLARSQPILAPKQARARASRSCSGERSSPRAARRARGSATRCRSARPRTSRIRSRRKRGSAWSGSERGGCRPARGPWAARPSTIHSASARPAPPAPRCRPS